MNKQKCHIDAFSLPAVVVISTLVMMLILFAFSLKTLDFQNHDHYRDLKQTRLDLHSAAALYMCDSTLLFGTDTATVCLYGDGEDPIGIKRLRWGMYEAVSIRRFKDDPFGRTYLMGRAVENSCRAALWLSNRNMPLTLAGSTNIKGPVFVPQVGVRSLDFPEKKFSGRPVEVEDLRAAGRYMPRLSWDMWSHLDTLKAMREFSCDYASLSRKQISFDEPTLLTHYDSHKETAIQLRGNAVLYGDRVILSKESDVKEVIIIARSVVLNREFKGSAQIFCADSILVAPGAELQYPSGLFVDSTGPNAPCITIGEGSTVNGYVGIHWGEKYHYVLENPCFWLLRNAHIRGLAYIDGASYIQGSIQGAAYIKDCIYRYGNSTYAEALCDVSIEREDSLAFPIMLDGPYRRKIIKTLN